MMNFYEYTDKLINDIGMNVLQEEWLCSNEDFDSFKDFLFMDVNQYIFEEENPGLMNAVSWEMIQRIEDYED